MANTTELASRISRLPAELQDHIYAYVDPTAPRPERVLIPRTGNRAADPSIPPANGHCVFFKLPEELRAIILGFELPAKNSIIKPTCGELTRRDSAKPPKPNRTSDLMVINKKIKKSVTLAVYQEREFEMHVHQGTYTAGVEVLNNGRQPLHFQLDTSDARFETFTEHGDFKFGQLKKIHIKIYQPEREARDKITTSNTYFIHQGLCGLLERNQEEEKDRIVSIRISFASPEPDAQSAATGRTRIMSNEHYWWDPDQKKPRSTCLQGISDVELVLRPFSRLSKVHNVDIELPKGVAGHAPTIQFKNDLVRSMTCKHNEYSLPAHNILEAQMRGPRIAAENFIRYEKYGGKPGNDVDDIDAYELFNHTTDLWPKRDRSRDSSPTKPKRQKTAMLRHESSLGLEFGQIDLTDENEYFDEAFEWEDMSGEGQWVMMEEQRAIERSLRDSQAAYIRREPSDGSAGGVPLTGQLHRMRFQRELDRAGPPTRNQTLDAVWPPMLPENVQVTSDSEPSQSTGIQAWQAFAKGNAEKS